MTDNYYNFEIFKNFISLLMYLPVEYKIIVTELLLFIAIHSIIFQNNMIYYSTDYYTFQKNFILNKYYIQKIEFQNRKHAIL